MKLMKNALQVHPCNRRSRRRNGPSPLEFSRPGARARGGSDAKGSAVRVPGARSGARCVSAYASLYGLRPFLVPFYSRVTQVCSLLAPVACSRATSACTLARCLFADRLEFTQPRLCVCSPVALVQSAGICQVYTFYVQTLTRFRVAATRQKAHSIQTAFQTGQDDLNFQWQGNPRCGGLQHPCTCACRSAGCCEDPAARAVQSHGRASHRSGVPAVRGRSG